MERTKDFVIIAPYINVSLIIIITVIMKIVITLGPTNSTGITFLSELGSRFMSITEDSCKMMYLFQRVSLAILRYNSVAYKGTFLVLTKTD